MFTAAPLDNLLLLGMPLANFMRPLHKLELHACAFSKQHAAAA